MKYIYNISTMNVFIDNCDILCQSKLFQLLMVFIIQFGGAHLFLEIENSKKVLEYVFSTILMKFVLIFAISITVTKDVKVSLLSSILVSSILVLLINKKSNFCLLPNVCFQRVENFQDTKIQDKK